MFPSPLYYGSVSLSFSSSLSSAPPLFSAQQQRRNQRKRENNGLSFCASLPPDDKGYILNRFESIQERLVERNKRRLRGTVNANYAASTTNRGCYFVASSAAAMSSDDEKKLYKLTLMACLSMLAFGAACGCIAGALVYVDFGTPSSVVLLSSKVKGAIVAALPLGAATACLAIGSKSASERFGRRDIFRFANVLYLVFSRSRFFIEFLYDAHRRAFYSWSRVWVFYRNNNGFHFRMCPSENAREIYLTFTTFRNDWLTVCIRDEFSHSFFICSG